MKKVNLLFVLLTTVSALAQGEIIFANRNIPTASGTGGGNGNGTYNVPIWEFNPSPGVETGNGAGDLPGGVTVGLFTTGGSLIGSSLLRTDANSQFFATAAQILKVPNAQPGTTATLLVRFWQGPGGFDAAKNSSTLQWGETSFTTKPLGGTNTSGAIFPIPGMTGWGPENGTGWGIVCLDCGGFPPPVEVAITLKPGFNLVANPLNTSDSTIGSLFKNMDGGVPGGTTVYRLVNGNFVPVIWDDLDNKFVPESLAIQPTYPGGGVFLWLPGSADKVLRISGTRPQSVCVSIPHGFSILSNGAPLPAKPEITPVVMGNNPGGDILFRFNPVTTAYTPYVYDDLDNRWMPDLPTIAPGEAYLYYRAGPGVQSCTSYP